jgi:hypothetical protein
VGIHSTPLQAEVALDRCQSRGFLANLFGMKKRVADLLSELGDLISQQKLYLSALRHMGASNIWVQFYDDGDEYIKLFSIVMFDTAYGNAEKQVVNPANLHKVLRVDISNKRPHGMKRLIIRFEESGIVEEYHMYFSEMAFHISVRPVHRIGHQ